MRGPFGPDRPLAQNLIFPPKQLGKTIEVACFCKLLRAAHVTRSGIEPWERPSAQTVPRAKPELCSTAFGKDHRLGRTHELWRAAHVTRSGIGS